MPTEAGRRQRDAALAAMQERGVQPMPETPIHVKTVGVSFIEAYPQNLLDLQRMLFDWVGDEPLTVVLVREPDNPYDSQAIAVHVPALGERGMVGHIPKVMAARIAPEMDAGVPWAAYVRNILISPANPNQPGIEITIQRARVQQEAHFVGDGTAADDLGFGHGVAGEGGDEAWSASTGNGNR